LADGDMYVENTSLPEQAEKAGVNRNEKGDER
jgi:hypothetical protein